MGEEDLKKEAERATEVVGGKTVRVLWRHRSNEIGLEFTDGTRLFVNCKAGGAEMSITGDQVSQNAQVRYSERCRLRG